MNEQDKNNEDLRLIEAGFPASKRREKDKMLNDYFGERKRKKRPWGYSGVIGSA